MSTNTLDTGLWFRRFDPAPSSQLRLVCFPHAGGAATSYRPLSIALAPDIETLCVQYPGRQDRRREAALTDLDELAGRITENMPPHEDKPLAFFGHSMGAVLAFEVAARLERSCGLRPAVVFVSGREAPGVYRHERVHLLDDAGLIANIRRLSGTDERVLQDEEVLRLVLPSIRGDYQAVETYRPSPSAQAPISSPISVLIGDTDPRVSPEEAAQWREYTHGSFDVSVYPGGHFYLTECWTEIAGQIRRALPG
jgi:surfactin synthase thioesterase subunit